MKSLLNIQCYNLQTTKHSWSNCWISSVTILQNISNERNFLLTTHGYNVQTTLNWRKSLLNIQRYNLQTTLHLRIFILNIQCYKLRNVSPSRYVAIITHIPLKTTCYSSHCATNDHLGYEFEVGYNYMTSEGNLSGGSLVQFTNDIIQSLSSGHFNYENDSDFPT